jgi:hypothetical protein
MQIPRPQTVLKHGHIYKPTIKTSRHFAKALAEHALAVNASSTTELEEMFVALSDAETLIEADKAHLAELKSALEALETCTPAENHDSPLVKAAIRTKQLCDGLQRDCDIEIEKLADVITTKAQSIEMAETSLTRATKRAQHKLGEAFALGKSDLPRITKSHPKAHIPKSWAPGTDVDWELDTARVLKGLDATHPVEDEPTDNLIATLLHQISTKQLAAYERQAKQKQRTEAGLELEAEAAEAEQLAAQMKEF